MLNDKAFMIQKELVPLLNQIKRIHLVSGLVEATLIFALCASFSGALFNEDNGLAEYSSLGMQSFMISAVLSGFLQSYYSSLELSLAAPDIVPTLVLANLLTYAAQSNPSIQGNIQNNLALVSLCTLLTGVGSLIAGKIGLSSQATGRVPDYIFNGFVVVAGFLIISKGIKMSMPKPVYEQAFSDSGNFILFCIFSLCGLPHALGMFIQKRYTYFTRPEIAFPVILFSPLIFFFFLSIIIYGPFDAFEGTRSSGWMLESKPSSYFYDPIKVVYFDGVVNVFDIITSSPILLIISVMLLTGDVAFKALGTIKMLESKISIDEEMVLTGYINILLGIFCGVPSYSQMKLASINISIVNKSTPSRIPGFISCSLLGILFISGFPLVKYVPRFWLAGMLYNVGINFIVDAFWDSNMKRNQKIVVGFMVLLFVTRSYFFNFENISLPSN